MGYPYRDKKLAANMHDLNSSIPKSTREVKSSTQGCYIIHYDALIMSMQSFFSATLAGDDISRLVRENSGKSIDRMAEFLRNHLDRTYPTQYWLVTVYRDVTGYDKHTFYAYNRNRVSYKFRHYGFNYVVTRYPKRSARSPSVSISSVVGSITRDDALQVAKSIKSKFAARGLTYTTIHVVKKTWKGWWWFTYGMTLATATSIPSRNYFWREFSNVIVIVVAPY